MASRFHLTSSVGAYAYYHVNSFGTDQTLPTSISNSGPALDLSHGVFLGSVVLADPGSGCTLTLYHGPAANGKVIAVIKPSTNATLHFDCALDEGLHWTYAGTTAGSVTFSVMPQPF